MLRTVSVALAALVGLLGVGLGVFMARAEVDYTNPPPKNNTMRIRLEGCQVNLADAIQAACEQADGKAESAHFDFSGPKPLVRVKVYGEGKAHWVVVDGQEGSVVKSEEIPDFAWPGAPVQGEPVTTGSGLSYYELSVGEGAVPPAPSAKVQVHYTGWLLDGTKFDSSVDRGQPATFPLDRVIAGWTEGVGSMKVGGKRKLVIPFDLAYGEAGRAPTIPAKATLVFDVELLKIVE